MSNNAPWLLHLDEKNYDEAVVARMPESAIEAFAGSVIPSLWTPNRLY